MYDIFTLTRATRITIYKALGARKQTGIFILPLHHQNDLQSTILLIYKQTELYTKTIKVYFQLLCPANIIILSLF